MTAVLERAKELSKLPAAAKSVLLAVGAFVLYYACDNVLLPQGLPPGILINGLVSGSFYALVAIGIVLIYRANRVINFAQADIGAVAAVLAISFKLHGMNYWVALVLGLIIAAAIGALINVAVIRRFRQAPRLIVAVATIGVAQILSGISLIIPLVWPANQSTGYTTPFEFRFTIFPVLFSGNHLVAMIVVPAVTAAVIAFLRYTDYGIVIRASAENGDRASLLGIPVPRLGTIVWALAALLSAVAVLLRVPILGFSSFVSVSGAGNALLLRTLAAAVIGRMDNMGRTVVAALAIGVFDQAASWQVPRTTIVDAMLVVIILGALLAQRGLFTRAAETGISTWRSIKEVRPVPEELRKLPEVAWTFRALKLSLVVFLVTFPLWAQPSKEGAMTLVLIYSMIAISLLILTGWAGHISLGQFALVGFGAAATSVLYGRHHWDFTLALVGGIVCSALVALVIGLPALRVRGPYLAVTTLAFAVTSSTFFLEDRYLPWFIEGDIVRPTLWSRLPLEENWQVYLLALAGFGITLWIARNLRYSHIGRVLIAVRDNEIQAEANTINAMRAKLMAFVISGAIAGFAGGIYVVVQRGLNTDSFGSEVSIQLFSMVVIGGLGSLPGAVLGAVYVRSAEFFLPPAYSFLATGFGILFLLLFLPEGLGGLMYRIRDAFLRKVANRRGILVPSLVADKRVVQEDAPVVIDTALSGLSGPGAPAQEVEAIAVEHDDVLETEHVAVPATNGSTNGSANGNGRRRRVPRREDHDDELTTTGAKN